MSAKSYKDNLKQVPVTLSDGTAIKVRVLKPYHWAQSGAIPSGFFDEAATSQSRAKAISGEEERILGEFQRIAFLQGVVPAEDFVPVDKPVEECGENEISLGHLYGEDRMKILNAALKGEPGETPGTFPAGAAGEKA